MRNPQYGVVVTEVFDPVTITVKEFTKYSYTREPVTYKVSLHSDEGEAYLEANRIGGEVMEIEGLADLEEWKSLPNWEGEG